MVVVCGRVFGRTKGVRNPIKRKCVLPKGHKGRHSDLPPLDFLKSIKYTRKAADKARRDAENTKGVAWPTVADDADKSSDSRKNREARWDIEPTHPYFATYETCLEVARRLTLYIFEMKDAPDCPPEMIKYLERVPKRGSYVCPICGEPVTIEQINMAEVSKAVIETAHRVPFTRGGKHEPDNVFLGHRECNIAQGNQTISEFCEWIASILRFHGYDVAGPG